MFACVACNVEIRKNIFAVSRHFDSKTSRLFSLFYYFFFDTIVKKILKNFLLINELDAAEFSSQIRIL